jgi:hypothetical protein
MERIEGFLFFPLGKGFDAFPYFRHVPFEWGDRLLMFDTFLSFEKYAMGLSQEHSPSHLITTL